MSIKYIIKKDINTQLEVPILFPEFIDHSAFKCLGKIISAGFCSIEILYNSSNKKATEFHVKCWGLSNSLKVKSRFNSDEILILRMIKEN